MATRSRVLGILRSVPPDTFTDVFVVPAGRVAIVRRWSILNRTSGTRSARLGVRRAGLVTEIARWTAIASFDYRAETDTNLVLDAGDALVVYVGNEVADNAIHCYAGGSLLDGPPA